MTYYENYYFGCEEWTELRRILRHREDAVYRSKTYYIVINMYIRKGHLNFCFSTDLYFTVLWVKKHSIKITD